MHYRYKLVVVDGADGYVIRHKSDDENTVFTLGVIEDYIYISATDISTQPNELIFEEVILTDELKAEFSKQRYLAQAKLNARGKIRAVKDFEDDLTDLKKIVQFMARGMASIWDTLPQTQKDANAYKDAFDEFSIAVKQAHLRLDLEANQVSKIAKILADEVEFAGIVSEEYLSKVR